MSQIYLTDRKLPTLRGDGVKEINYIDSKIAGFALRVSPRGARTFVLRYSINGKQKRWRIGTPKQMTVEEARRKAASALDGLHRGIDPQAEKVKAAGVWTCTELIDRYMAELRRRAVHR